jgi:hypothetical protein
MSTANAKPGGAHVHGVRGGASQVFGERGDLDIAIGTSIDVAAVGVTAALLKMKIFGIALSIGLGTLKAHAAPGQYLGEPSH